MIREFELCDENKLDEILSYPRLVETGKANTMEDIDYNNNYRVYLLKMLVVYIK